MSRKICIFVVFSMKKLLVNIIRGCLIIVGKLPLKFNYFIGDVFSWFAKKVAHYRSNVVCINLSRSFPDKKYWWIKNVYNDFYKHLGEVVGEAIWFCGSDEKRLHKSGLVTITNPGEINEYFQSSPSMTVLCTHCGNWELLGGLLCYKTETGEKLAVREDDVTVVYKKLASEISDEVFKRNRMTPLKTAGTDCAVESSNILRFAIKNRDRRKMYIYPTDQAPYKKAAKYPIGEFMHQNTNAMLGSVGLACKFSHSVMYMKMKRVERGKYEMTFIPICRNASEMTPEDIMRKYYDLLEMEINETPANWLWTHKRWK